MRVGDGVRDAGASISAAGVLLPLLALSGAPCPVSASKSPKSNFLLPFVLM
ncbi:hypothetical protein GQ55_5G121200 [Panicum hallii var. hallii]|uniref:Uncharacterized protein n=2 Tax=Panicum hallii TaxID=206008 RepID=A0A2T7DFI9_9POAL|nr:hypothetical protein GQ55_5G121200 [Panicum hallii var. hallii]PVH37909.1 hypothetical protein PAHAL_5G119500 [Panicum hallii]